MKTFKIFISAFLLISIFSTCSDQEINPNEQILNLKSETPIIGEDGEYILEPQIFTRGDEEPTTFKLQLNINDYECFSEPYYINLINGDGNGLDAVSSALIKIDNVVIFNQSDFNKKVRDLISNISIQMNSVLEVELRGKPDTYVTISIEGTYNSCLWEHNYGTDFREVAGDFLSTLDGGYIFVGYIDESHIVQNKTVAWVVKISKTGLLEWEKRYEDVNSMSAITQNNSGGYVATGFSGTFKLSETGNLEWQRLNIKGTDVIYTRDNGYLVVGNESASKLTNSGDLLWTTELSNFNSNCAIEDLSAEGEFIIGGNWRTYDTYEDKFAAARLNKNGDVVWLNTYKDNIYYSVFNAIVHDDKGGFTLVGNQYFVANIENDGSLVWFKKLTVPPEYGGGWGHYDIIKSPNGYIIGTGIGNDVIPWLVEMDDQGTQLREKIIQKPCRLVGIVLCGDERLVIGGNKEIGYINGIYNSDYWAEKINFYN